MATTTQSPTTFRQVPTDTTAEKKPSLPGRLVSLDAFRGFIMTMLAARAFGLHAFGEEMGWTWLSNQFEHVAWEGIVFWDLIQPSFMFMVGLAMPFSFRRRSTEAGKGSVWKHVLYRAFMLILISQVLMSVSAGEPHFQLINVLAQIGLAYLVCYAVMQLPFKTQLAAGAGILVLHTALFHLFPGSDGAWSPTDNVGARIDHFFGLEYSGYYVTLNFLASAVTLLIGVWCGKLMLEDRTHNERMRILATAMVGCWAAGYALSLVNPLVKRLWTASFTLASAGWVILILLAFYYLVEVRNMRKATFPLVVVGMNSIFIYSVAMILYGWTNRAVGVFTGNFEFLGPVGIVAQATATFAVLWYVCYWLYQRRIFIRV